jgi:hypothetical protein
VYRLYSDPFCATAVPALAQGLRAAVVRCVNGVLFVLSVTTASTYAIISERSQKNDRSFSRLVSVDVIRSRNFLNAHVALPPFRHKRVLSYDLGLHSLPLTCGSVKCVLCSNES